MIGFIYFLRNPETKEIVYVGATKSSLKDRLRTHYMHAKEANKGNRKMTKRYAYLLNMLPIKLTIHLVDIVPDFLLDNKEEYYIELFRSWDMPLLNMTDGGRGGHTFKYYTKEEILDYTDKISKALTGTKKPEGFSEALSVARTGTGNPMAGTGSIGSFVAINNGKLVKRFDYPFEVEEFLGKKKSWSNIKKVLQGKLKYKPYGYDWMLYSEYIAE